MSTAKLSLDRFEREVKLQKGAHKHRSAESVCAMEAVAWLAGEPHSDAPDCVCLVIAALVRRLNDSRLFEGYRDELKPILPSLIGTSTADRDVYRRRGYLAADYAVRKLLPIACRAMKREDLAVKMESVTPVADEQSARNASSEARAVRSVFYRAADAADDADADDADDADYAAYAADYTADAALAADYAALAADYAALAADYAAAAKAKLCEICIDLVRGMVAIKPAAQAVNT